MAASSSGSRPRRVRPRARAELVSNLSAQLPPAAMPETPEPMLCTLVGQPFDSPGWVFEPKYDGLRILARFDGQDLTLLSRNQKSQNVAFPDVVESLRASLAGPAIVDGEVVCLDDSGRTSFRALQQRFHLQDAAEVRRRSLAYPAIVCLFDILYVDRFDVTGLPLERRKALLQESVRWTEGVRWTEFTGARGTELWDEACRAGSEGIVAKRLDSRYVAGRSDAWLKIKCVGRQEFVIGGWTDPQRSRVGLGALLVGYYSDDGASLRYAGKVGTGYTRETLRALRERFSALGRRGCPFEPGEADLPGGPGVHWVEPRLVAEIAFAEWTQNGLLRQPRYEGLRPDKSPRECRRERPEPSSAARRRARAASVPDVGATAMPLEPYNAKRDFTRTDEPEGRPAQGHAKPIFVIQEHHASHLHYDFRLEADGVLKSWAVPKEPTLDPAAKRLAVQVEDHPLDYATFEGTIPQGQYGGGTVALWDHGTYDNLLADKPAPQTVAQGIDQGRLEFTLHGEKLRGRFALIRMKARGRGKPQWLLIKAKDEFAQAAGQGGARPATPPRHDAAPSKRAPAARPGPKGAKARAPREGVAVTHPEKLMFPEAGLTKADLFAYYGRIADRLLPFLKDRPVTLERLPEGLAGTDAPHFWQKNTPASYPAWIPRVALETEQGKPVDYVLVNDRDTLLYLVNQGTVTFHVWSSRVEDLDRPDFVLFDLDPGKATFADVVAVARALHEVLDGEGVESYLKTSGKSGLHVLVPWPGGEGGFDEARAWAGEVSARVVEALPDRATGEIRKAKRQRRVYIDVLQNARGHHAVPPYVIRAVPAATISTPLGWKELTPDLDPTSFTAKSIFRRLARLKTDPISPLASQISRRGRRTRAAK